MREQSKLGGMMELKGWRVLGSLCKEDLGTQT